MKKPEIVGYSGMALTAISLLLLGSANLLGWILAVAGSAVWIGYAVVLRLYPILGINLILIAIDIRGLILWLH